MPASERSDVDSLKTMLSAAWNKAQSARPPEHIYAFGLYTNESGQSMTPFVMTEEGLSRTAQRYVNDGIYGQEEAAEELRWSTADSPYAETDSADPYAFDGRPDSHGLTPAAAKREVRYRLTAACDALAELDREGLFGTGNARERVTLYLEGGDVNRAWTLTWAKRINPESVYDRFAAVGATIDAAGTDD